MDAKTLNFIEKSRKIHGDKYDYSLTKYVKNNMKVIIGYKDILYEVSPSNHLKGSKIENRKTFYSIDLFKSVAGEKHNNRYLYDKVIFKKIKDNICITCKIHGDFFQNGMEHLNGHGCPKCGKVSMGNIIKLNIDEINKRIFEKHGNKYSYLNLNEYSDMKSILEIICPFHGNFKQKLNLHINHGCKKCGYKISKNKGLIKFLEQSNLKWDNFYIYDKFEYIRSSIKSIIICPIHGEFYQTPNTHLRAGCKKCGYEKISINSAMCGNEFITRGNQKHNFKYDYSLVKYKNSRTKVNIICPIHGPFYQNAQSHLSGSSCPNCNESIGESKIRIYLEKNDIKFIRQQKFNGCRNILELPFDFFLYSYNVCIEFDGKQHFEQMKFFGGEDGFKYLKNNDCIKTKYCFDNNIRLIRIPYYDINNIENILKNELK